MPTTPLAMCASASAVPAGTPAPSTQVAWMTVVREGDAHGKWVAKMARLRNKHRHQETEHRAAANELDAKANEHTRLAEEARTLRDEHVRKAERERGAATLVEVVRTNNFDVPSFSACVGMQWPAIFAPPCCSPSNCERVIPRNKSNIQTHTLGVCERHQSFRPMLPSVLAR